MFAQGEIVLSKLTAIPIRLSKMSCNTAAGISVLSALPSSGRVEVGH